MLWYPFAIHSFFFFVIDLICTIEPYKEKSHSSYNEWLYYIYSLICSSELVSMYLVQSKRLYFLRSVWIYAMSFIDTTMILKNFSKSNKNARNFYSAFELIFQKGSLHKFRKDKVEKIYSPYNLGIKNWVFLSLSLQ